MQQCVCFLGHAFEECKSAARCICPPKLQSVDGWMEMSPIEVDEWEETFGGGEQLRVPKSFSCFNTAYSWDVTGNPVTAAGSNVALYVPFVQTRGDYSTMKPVSDAWRTAAEGALKLEKESMEKQKQFVTVASRERSSMRGTEARAFEAIQGLDKTGLSRVLGSVFLLLDVPRLDAIITMVGQVKALRVSVDEKMGKAETSKELLQREDDGYAAADEVDGGGGGGESGFMGGMFDHGALASQASFSSNGANKRARHK